MVKKKRITTEDVVDTIGKNKLRNILSKFDEHKGRGKTSWYADGVPRLSESCHYQLTAGKVHCKKYFIGDVRRAGEKEHSKWIDYIFDPKVSPWAPILDNVIPITDDKDVVVAFAMLNPEKVNKRMFVNLCFATRFQNEWSLPITFDLFTKLTEKFNPTFAFYISRYFALDQRDRGRVKANPHSITHHYFLDSNSHLEQFLQHRAETNCKINMTSPGPIGSPYNQLWGKGRDIKEGDRPDPVVRDYLVGFGKQVRSDFYAKCQKIGSKSESSGAFFKEPDGEGQDHRLNLATFVKHLEREYPKWLAK